MQTKIYQDQDKGFLTFEVIRVTGDADIANNGTLNIPLGDYEGLPFVTGSVSSIYVGNSNEFPVAESGANTIGFNISGSNVVLTNRTGVAWKPGTFLRFTVTYRVGFDAVNARLDAIEARLDALEA